MGIVDGQVAVVTGGAQGIGATLARALAAEGARVVVSDILDTSESVDAITKAGGEAIGTNADVTDNDSLRTMVDAAESAFGPIGILINNAGLFGTLDLKPFTEITEDEWDLVFRVNVRGMFQTTKAVVSSMKRNGKGAIVNIGSGTLFRGAPMFMHYVGSKGAVFAMTRSMARELADDHIRANCVTAGFTASKGVLEHPQMMDLFKEYTINTRMIKREMVPEDLSGTVLYLASDQSAFITGQTVNVDGGAVTY